MLVRITNRKDHDQTAQTASGEAVSDLGLHCLSRPFRQATSDRDFRTFTVRQQSSFSECLWGHWMVPISIPSLSKDFSLFFI